MSESNEGSAGVLPDLVLAGSEEASSKEEGGSCVTEDDVARLHAAFCDVVRSLIQRTTKNPEEQAKLYAQWYVLGANRSGVLVVPTQADGVFHTVHHQLLPEYDCSVDANGNLEALRGVLYPDPKG